MSAQAQLLRLLRLLDTDTIISTSSVFVLTHTAFIECIQTIFSGHWPLVFLLFLSLTIFPPMISIIIAHASRVYCSVIPRSPCPPHSPCFSFSHFQPVSLSPSLCPLLCQQCNFSLQWENRYNRGSVPVCLIKE